MFIPGGTGSAKIAQEVVVRFDLTCGAEADDIALPLARVLSIMD